MTVVGIALYSKPTPTPDPKSLRWALVLHPKRFHTSDTDVSIHYVRRQHDSWAPKHLTGSLLSLERGDQSSSFIPSSSIPGSNHGMVLIAVLHVATIPNDFGVLRTYLKSFPPLANLDGRCTPASVRTQITLSHASRAAACRWSSAAWVVYVLTSMVRREMVVLPCRLDEVYDHVLGKIREAIKIGPRSVDADLGRRGGRRKRRKSRAKRRLEDQDRDDDELLVMCI